MKTVAAIALSLFLTHARACTVELPPVMHNGSVVIEELSTPGNLDGFKMKTSANSSSYDYWWFDAVSNSNDAALNIVFYNAGDIGNPQPLAVEISGTFGNGTRFFKQVLAPGGAVISNGPEGVSGQWKGTGASFRGTNLEKPNVEYEVIFDSPELGVHGSLKLKSRAPAHYPCDPNVPGVTQLHLPRFFWSNAVPDADVIADLNINGTDVSFEGIGYHDKNWGDQTILKSPKFWDWGHTRFGPYSVVWYDLLDRNNTEYHRSYIAKDGEIVKVSCDEGSVITRPWGFNATWPPAGGLNSVEGVVSRFELGNETLVVNVTKERITYDALVYTRATGSVVGGIEGSNVTWEGRAFFDEFTYGLMFG
ncbi:uncharacterized protein CTRU02_201213 [Colletotrichum truncatum]|uniref:Uncharacterized protein n=1 Tax=Colletotrichum truncatum TaxID=5467 RepID=A0ACC3ZHB6_COLTU|nr:uncharacterized protein CTRU02_08001 [Colletotrichum truncatum]KAF6790481.1 hypothetical protein CTRU02_08001 [Colletotrichum truncatum]